MDNVIHIGPKPDASEPSEAELRERFAKEYEKTLLKEARDAIKYAAKRKEDYIAKRMHNEKMMAKLHQLEKLRASQNR